MQQTAIRQIGALIAVLLAHGLVATALAAPHRPAETNPLRIYFIDVEGGQSTLIVTPSGESLLVDAGWAGAERRSSFTAMPGDPHASRDARRIVAAAQDAGVKAIDDLLITHFHPDHDGGVPELAKLMPIHTFIDHGDIMPDVGEIAGSVDAFERYAAVRAHGRHLVPTPGERLPLQDVIATVVSATGSVIKTSLPHAIRQNPRCDAAPSFKADTSENLRSIGFVLRYGHFTFADLGDLIGAPLFDLFCPADLLGPIDAYLLPHHGAANGGAVPYAFGALPPRVAFMDNGPMKGGGPAMFEFLHASALEDVWQLHRSLNPGAQNFASDRIANLDDSGAFWLELTAHPDGSFSVANPRTGAIVHYPARRPAAELARLGRGTHPAI